jgi:hypothetical protein
VEPAETSSQLPEFGILHAIGNGVGNKKIRWRETMALEKKSLSKKASTSTASKSKRNVKGKVDTTKPSPTKVATAMMKPFA